MMRILAWAWSRAAQCLAVAAALLLSACSAPPVEPDLLTVVATTSIIGDVVANVAGDRVELKVLMGRGVDPHTYQLTPRDAARISEAQLVFVNGFGLEESLLETIQELAPPDAILFLSEGIEPRHMAEASRQAEGEHEHGGDPHVWFDPSNVEVWAKRMANALSGLDSEGEAGYRENAAEYIAELRELDSWIENQVSQIPLGHRVLVTDHDALGYFADRYGFEIVGSIIPGLSTAAEASAEQRAKLEEEMKEHGVRAVFVGVTVNPNLARQLAQDLGIALVPLYTGSLSEPQGPAATYLAFMRYNVEAMVEALQ